VAQEITVAEDSRPEEQGEGEQIEERFPNLPPPEAPDVPELKPKLPPHPDRHSKPGAVEPGSYNKMALAATAASSFIMPIVALSVLGWWLDNRLHHETSWLAFIGVLVGMVVGISSLLRVMNRLSE
jgi:hypothetical protein